MLVDLDADEVEPAVRAAAMALLPRPRNGSMRQLDAVAAVQPEAVLGQLRGEGRGVGTILVAILDRLVGNEPRVAAASAIAAARAPAGDIGRVLISTPIARRSSGVRPSGVKWKTNSWQSLTNRSLLIGL